MAILKIGTQTVTPIMKYGLSDLEAERKGFIFTPVAVTVKTDATHTANIATNPNLGYVTEETEATLAQFPSLGVVTRLTDLNGTERIFKRWSLAEINARWVANGFKRTVAEGGTHNLTEPIGLAVNCNGRGWQLFTWGYFSSQTYYGVTGATAVDHPNNLRHSHWFGGGSPFYNSAATGTDSEADITNNTDASGVAGKMLSAAWAVEAVTDDADHWNFYTANTGRRFLVPKGCAAANALTDNEWDRTEYMWQFTEWYRHSYAIYSGKTTSDIADVTEVLILNSSGNTAAVGEDMFFWLTDGTNKVNTGLLAKYNINAQHGTNGGSSYRPLRSAERDFIYNTQKTNGVNMNDTGVNSASKPVLTEGSKGAEAILVGNRWMIATPIITRASSTSDALDYNVPDAPAVSMAKHRGLAMCSDKLGMTYYPHRTTIYYQMVNYLVTEGWFDATGRNNRMIYYTSGYGSSGLFCAAHYNANYAWYVGVANGGVLNMYTSARYRCALSALIN